MQIDAAIKTVGGFMSRWQHVNIISCLQTVLTLSFCTFLHQFFINSQDFGFVFIPGFWVTDSLLTASNSTKGADGIFLFLAVFDPLERIACIFASSV